MRDGRRPKGANWVALAAGFLLPLGAAAMPRASLNLIELHHNAGKHSNKECLSCHGAILKVVTSAKTFHRLHLESKLDTPKKCSACHASIDLRNGSAAALRKQVDPALCASCHDGGMDGAKVLFAK